MISTTLLDLLPLGVILVGTSLLALLAIELGFRLGRAWQHRTHIKKEGPVGAIAAAVLGLLAFLLAFLTGMALQRFDNQRALVVDEANAISTAFLYAGFIDQPTRTEARVLLREYVELRLAAFEGTVQLGQARARSEEIQYALWRQAEPLARADSQSATLPLYVEALNNMINVHTQRIMAVVSSRLPGDLWLGIYVVAMLSMALVGIQTSYSERRNWLTLVVLVVVFSLVLALIVDLDRPTEGVLVVSQQALQDLQAEMQAVMP